MATARRNDHPGSVTILALVVQVCFAGFLAYPVVVGFYAWNPARPDMLWVTMVGWSFVAAALLLVNAAYLWPGTSPALLGTLLTVRHVLVGLQIVAVLLVLQELCGGVPRVLAWVIVGLVVVRGVLWFTTDLVWAHAVDVSRVAQYGPLRNPLAVALTVLFAAAGVLATLRRPWRSELARRGLLYAILPGFLLGLLVLVPGPTGELSVSTAFVPSLIALQLMYFADFRHRQDRLRVLAAREARLADFGADVLSDRSQVPELAAVTLVTDVLQADCVYQSTVPDGDDIGRRAPRRRRWNADDEHVAEYSAPIHVLGETAGVLRARVVAATDDDRAFVAAVATMLSSALERSAAETRLRMSAVSDPVTALPNWALLLDRLNRLLSQAEQFPLAIVCCDVRGLKDVNDEFGRDAGDEVLRVLAQRLASVIGPAGTVARIGADEFVVAEPRLDAPAAEALADRVAETAGDAIATSAGPVPVRLWVGFTVAESADRSAGRLVRDAEMAVMSAKRQQAQTAAYSDRVRAQLVGRRLMIRDLHDAIAGARITVAYQPIVDLGTSQAVAVEALARWSNARGEEVPPPVFVHLAEESGAIRDLSALVFEQAVSDLARWGAEDPALRQLRLSLNLAPAQLTDDEVVRRLETLLSGYGIAPERITVEFTESGLQLGTAATAGHLARFRELGVGVSLDDFGTGYSSLTRLMAFPVTELKIDREFTLASQDSARLIVPAVVGLAHASGLAVVVEGIEADAQRCLAVSQGCDFGQGYFFAPPLPAGEVAAAVAARRRHAVA